MTLIPDYAPRGNRARFSKLACAAIVLTALHMFATISVGPAILDAAFRPKDVPWSSLGIDLMFVLVLIGGTICAVPAILLGAAALWRIRRNPHTVTGRRTARAAVFISSASLVLAWSGVITSATYAAHRRAMHLSAKADILLVFNAARQYAQGHGSFPDTLEQIVSPELAARYVYSGQGVPLKYADYYTPRTDKIVVMYTKEGVNGTFVAVYASGRTWEWTKPALDRAILNSEAERAARGIPGKAGGAGK